MAEFNGFSEDLVQFFKNLGKNNTKPWKNRKPSMLTRNISIPVSQEEIYAQILKKAITWL